MKILDVQHELMYDHDNVVISLPKSERARINEWLETLHIRNDKDYTLSIKQHREKRSLDANSYYWVLVGKIASVLGASKTEVHNQELGKYGAYLTDSEGSLIYTLCKASIDYLNDEHVHLKPTGRTEDRNGTLYAWFVTMKPSHSMDSGEFSALLDGCISDCKELNIEVLSPDEINRLKAIGEE